MNILFLIIHKERIMNKKLYIQKLKNDFPRKYYVKSKEKKLYPRKKKQIYYG